MCLKQNVEKLRQEGESFPETACRFEVTQEREIISGRSPAFNRVKDKGT